MTHWSLNNNDFNFSCVHKMSGKEGSNTTIVMLHFHNAVNTNLGFAVKQQYVYVFLTNLWKSLAVSIVSEVPQCGFATVQKMEGTYKIVE